ncbi:EAL domain-containing protein [Vibrio sp. YMD68]|uniref:EAL domain-containing protein n=1 Tax=Vibrio sp. YMD68 TaxID=3042300 RepID=UPI00249A2E7C|nr:EAL domain-containing protein [Vibrio sp. YMD68]WGW01587.1 EAL domain-containing protein [Vibrio sp. YMD68]
MVQNKSTLDSEVPDVGVLETNSVFDASAVYEWYLNLDKREFDFDKKELEGLLNASNSISSMDDILEYMPGTQRRDLKDALVRVLKTGVSEYVNCTLMPKGTGFIQVEVYMEKPEKNAISGTFRPLIGLTSMDDLCEVFQILFENTHHGIVVTDSETRILTCNRYFEQLKGFKRNEMLGLKANIFNAGKYPDEFYQDMWRDIHEKGSWGGSILSRTAAGLTVPQDLTIQKVTFSNNKVYYLGIVVDLSNQLYRIADKGLGGVELLTQLPTKDRFVKLLEELCSSNTIDSRKVVIALQPSFGEENILENRQLFSDMLSRSRYSSLAGYLSNGVFVVCVESPSQKKISPQRALMKSISQFFQEVKLEGEQNIHEYVVSGRIGVSIIGYDTDVPKRAISHAMQAMMDSKPSGQTSISFYHSKTHKELERKKILEEIVRESIANHKLHVHYQPIIDTNTWQIAKFEALCRFAPVLNLEFTTQEMINIAEDLELVPQLDCTVGKIALGDFSKIRAVCGDNVGLTINRSLNTNLGTEQVLKETSQMLEHYADSFESITIELTESAYFESSPSQGKALQALRESGVQIAIDDFGTGYSSFNYLRERHFDILKIDREFVREITKGSGQYHIVKMITDLSHTLGIKVVAEGVETLGELSVLKALGVDYMQGYLFSKPVAIENIAYALDYQVALASELEGFRNTHQKLTLLKLATNVGTLDPSTPLVEVNERLQSSPSLTFPVIVNKKCVGLVSKVEVNLHLTPQMGTELESNREAAIWNRPVNQLMKTGFSRLDYRLSLLDLERYIEEQLPFPWVLVDEQGVYKGILELEAAMNYLLQKH